MTRQKRTKKPSRAKYEQGHPVFSARLDVDTYNRLKAHLAGTGCSFADFLKDAFGREESMVEKRVEMIASRQADPSIDDRVGCLESLLHELWSVAIDTTEYTPSCPQCDSMDLFDAEGGQTKGKARYRRVRTWACPKCGFFVNTAGRIDPSSLQWVDPDTGKVVPKPKRSVNHFMNR